MVIMITKIAILDGCSTHSGGNQGTQFFFWAKFGKILKIRRRKNTLRIQNLKNIWKDTLLSEEISDREEEAALKLKRLNPSFADWLVGLLLLRGNCAKVTALFRPQLSNTSCNALFLIFFLIGSFAHLPGEYFDPLGLDHCNQTSIVA